MKNYNKEYQQKSNGEEINKDYFKVPNDYQDAKCRIKIPGQAVQVLNVIERFTFGFNEKEATISFKTFRERTGMLDRHIMRARNRLIKMGIITTTKKGSLMRVCFRIQRDYTKWHPLPKKVVIEKEHKPLPKKVVKTTTKKGSQPLPKKTPSTSIAKDTCIKDTIFKDSESNIPTQQLKKRLEELKDDLKEEKFPGELNYIREGIKEIETQLKKAR